MLTQLDRYFNSNETYLSNLYYEEAYNLDFTIANKTGVITRWADSLSKQDWCIDLTFYNREISNYI